uniref:Putative ixodes 10 kDa peptide protein n=1 Tax=Ixodes ricinus TaxID=34613 RepID=A0A0K8RAF7_IXORI
MLLRTFVPLLLIHKFLYGVLSISSPLDLNDCKKLITQGGEIACNITGEGKYQGMSVGNCWVSCTEGSNKFLIPHRECERILGVESWDGYLKLFGELPQYGYEYCDDEYLNSLKLWVDEWKNYQKRAITNLCPNGKLKPA